MTAALELVRQWPMEDQVEFVQRAWDQISDAGWTPELTDAQKAELDRRLASYEANPSAVLTWEQVLAHLNRRR